VAKIPEHRGINQGNIRYKEIIRQNRLEYQRDGITTKLKKEIKNGSLPNTSKRKDKICKVGWRELESFERQRCTS